MSSSTLQPGMASQPAPQIVGLVKPPGSSADVAADPFDASPAAAAPVDTGGSALQPPGFSLELAVDEASSAASVVADDRTAHTPLLTDASSVNLHPMHIPELLANTLSFFVAADPNFDVTLLRTSRAFHSILQSLLYDSVSLAHSADRTGRFIACLELRLPSSRAALRIGHLSLRINAVNPDKDGAFPQPLERLCRLELDTHSLRSLEVVISGGFPEDDVLAALFPVARQVAGLVNVCANLHRLVLSGPDVFFAQVATSLATCSPTSVAPVAGRFEIDLPRLPFIPAQGLGIDAPFDVLRIQFSRDIPHALSPDQLWSLLLLMQRTLAGGPPVCRRLVLGPGLKEVLATASLENRRGWAAAEQIALHWRAALGFHVDFPHDLGVASLLSADPTERLQVATMVLEEIFAEAEPAPIAQEGP